MAPERTNRSMAPLDFIRGRKKASLAAGLAVVMGFMWVRVLTGHKPQAVGAADAPPPAKSAPAGQTPVKLKYVTLPVIPGRDDTIERDFFAGRNWSAFSKSSGSTTGTDTEVVQPNIDRTSENISTVAKKLNLQAVLLTGQPEAFINDQAVKVGDTFSFREGADLYLFEVKQIHDDSVLVECGGQSVTLKMK
jgi:hypothetical protein